MNFYSNLSNRKYNISFPTRKKFSLSKMIWNEPFFLNVQQQRKSKACIKRFTLKQLKLNNNKIILSVFFVKVKQYE